MQKIDEHKKRKNNQTVHERGLVSNVQQCLMEKIYGTGAF